MEAIIFGSVFLLGIATGLWIIATMFKPELLKHEQRIFGWLYGPEPPPKKQKKG